VAKVKKRKKKVVEKVDGLSPKDISRIRTAVREVWYWSTPRKLAIARAIGKDGFPRCDGCRKKVPKTYVDHLVNVGKVDGGFIKRMFVPSSGLQNLCKRCHDKKTREERAALKRDKYLDFD